MTKFTTFYAMGFVPRDVNEDIFYKVQYIDSVPILTVYAAGADNYVIAEIPIHKETNTLTVLKNKMANLMGYVFEKLKEKE